MNPTFHIIIGLILVGLSIYLIKNETIKDKKRYSIVLLIISIFTLIGGIGRFIIVLN
jgi:formate-dependent nitrite reductase membrane component NrfD